MKITTDHIISLRALAMFSRSFNQFNLNFQSEYKTFFEKNNSELTVEKITGNLAKDETDSIDSAYSFAYKMIEKFQDVAKWKITHDDQEFFKSTNRDTPESEDPILDLSQSEILELSIHAKKMIELYNQRWFLLFTPTDGRKKLGDELYSLSEDLRYKLNMKRITGNANYSVQELNKVISAHGIG